MRPEPNQVDTRAGRAPGSGAEKRSRNARKSQNRRVALEMLEPRTLLATLPSPSPADLPFRASTTLGDESSPSIAVSLNDPNKLVAVWTNFNDPTRVAPTPLGVAQAAFSTNGGATWNTFFTAGQVADPTTTNPQISLSVAQEAQVVFDRSDRVYMLTSQRNGGNTAGALVLNAFDFSGATPSTIDLTPSGPGTSNTIERWTANALHDISLAVDASVASFMDPSTGDTVVNPFAGTVYVSYVTTDTAPSLFSGTFNPNRIAVMASSNGGVSFSTPSYLNDNGNFGDQRNAAPRLAISQGTSDGRIQPGLVNVVWDDFGTGATSSPAFDIIKAEQTTPGVGARVTVTGQTINDSPGNDVVVTTNIPINVTAGDIPANFTTIRDLDVRLAITHPNLSQISVTLVPPQASGLNPITLFNADDLTGANLGIVNGVNVGTTFDDSASRNIFDPNNGGTNANAAPYVGTYRPRIGSLTNAFAGMTPTTGPNGLLGQWTLRITDDAQDTTAVQQVTSASLVLTSGLAADPTNNNNSNISVSFVRGGLDGTGQTASAATPRGISPAPVIASNNTLGSFSPYQGRLYVAYTNYIHPDVFGGNNPADNTDIHLAVSDNGGVTWNAVRGFTNPVNDDNGALDGFSEAIIDPISSIFNGRPQFMPSVAVDQSTGTLAMSWYDGRFDPARARVATYLTSSIDGGQTFSDQVYVNPDQARVNALNGGALPGGAVFDAATGRPLDKGLLGPLGDNQSTGNPVRDTTFSFGRTQGLAVAAGRAYPAWSGNQNFAGINADGANGGERLDIYVNPVAIGAGPRAVEDQNTMGPITPQRVQRLSDGSNILFNHLTAADGTPIFDGIIITFDRPIYFDPTLPVDPQSFGIDDVRVFYRDTTDDNSTGGAVAIEEIIPIIDPNSPLTTDQQRQFGASRFLIRTSPRTGVGTYSYQVGPNYTDTIRTANPDGSLRDVGNLSDQNANAIPAEPLVNGANITSLDVFAIPRPIGSNVQIFDNPLNPNDPRNGMILAPFSDDTLPVVLNGPRVEYITLPNEPFSNRNDDGDPTTPGTGDILAVDRSVQGLDVTFDRDMQVASLAGNDVLRLNGPTGPINGPFTIRPVYRNATASAIPDNGITSLVSSITVPADATNFTIADLDVNVDIRHPRSADLRIVLIAPDGTRIVLAEGLGGAIGRNYLDTIFDDGGALDSDPQGRVKTLTSITQAEPPFTGRFTPMNPLSALIGKTLAIPGAGGNVWQLEVTDVNGNNLPAGEVQQLVAWAITAAPQNPTADVVARSFRIEFFTPDPLAPTAVLPNIQRVSGTYALSFSPEVLSARGDQLDQNQNAGVDLLREFDPAGSTVPFLAQSTNVPRPLTDATLTGTGTTAGVTTSTLTVTEDFLIQGLTLNLTINHARVRDLTAVLINPAGDRVTLFSPNTIRVEGSNFTLTTFDDSAATFIFDGGPPFFGSFQPENPLSNVYLDSSGNPRRSAGTYTLEITDSRVGQAGTLANWSLTFRKPLIGDGLGEQVADRASANFRLFNLSASDPVASTNWTAVGPAGVNAESPSIVQNRWAGRVSAMAVDPSDPSGNTVYVSGASGGVWKTTNFLTTSPAGPTYIPLTDFGPNRAINVGSIAVFARNGNPDESIVYVATGEGDDSAGFGTGQTGRGIGFLRSMDGGRTWEVISGPNAQNPRGFVGLTAFKVVVDPALSTENQVLIYAALAGTSDDGTTTGGLWRSNDSGLTWEKMSVDSHGVQATDVILDPFSADSATGNLDRLYVAFRGTGVFRGTSRGQNLTQLLGGVGKPLVQDPDAPPDSIDVIPGGGAPPANDRIVLAQVFPTGVPSQDLSYQDWLYVAAVEGNNIAAIYSTKDRGENWTRMVLPGIDIDGDGDADIPSNDETESIINIGPNEGLGGNYAISLAVDPGNPHIVYLGGTSLIRVDTTVTNDAHNLTFFAANTPNTTQVSPLTNGASSGAIQKDINRGLGQIIDVFQNTVPYRQAINLVRNPATPLAANATFFVGNVAQFNNTGRNTYWTPFGGLLQGATRVHELFTFVDPVTGQARIIAATDQGVFSGVDYNGELDPGIGSASTPNGTRNGNLQVAQMHYGAVQPNLAAQIDALFYGSSWQIDFSGSNPNVLANGNLNWTDRDGLSFQGSGTGIATAQVNDPTAGAVYEFKWPGDGGRFTDFFQVNGVGRTVGLLRGQNDPQWPGLAPVLAPGIRFGNFAVNPINNNQVLISSAEGRLYSTEDQGRTWREIGVPTVFGGANIQSYAPAIAFGAPEPGVTAPGSLNDFLYVGTMSGQIFVTRTGGGAAGTAWTNISSGLDGSPVLSIITSPDRGTREAYAVTRAGVYYISDSTSGGPWQPITGNLFGQQHQPFGNSALTEADLVTNELHSIVADWRYVIPEDRDTPGSPVHPILYAAGNGGVFRSLDNGQTWTSFPDNIDSADPLNGTPADSGYLPNVRVTDLDLSLGFINPDNGRPLAAGSPNLLVASTYGRGQFAIRIAPLILEDTVRLSPTQPDPNGSDSGIGGITDASRFDRVTNVNRPYIEGISEQTAFGNVVRITIFDLTDPANPRIVGGYDPADPTTDIAANYTDDRGEFFIQLNEGAFAADGSDDGLKVLGIQAVNSSGTVGNVVPFEFTLDTIAPPTPIDPEAPTLNRPDLITGSDSGIPPFANPNTDDYTNDNTPTFAIGGIEAGNTVFLSRNGVQVATVFNAMPAGADNVIQITDNTAPADGIFAYTVRQVDQAGNPSPTTNELTVTIDTTPPAVPSQPVLFNPDDTGVKGDNTTANTRPRLTGTLALQPSETSPANLPLVQLVDSNNNVLGQARVLADGTYTIQFDQNLIDGVYIVQARAIDRAANVSVANSPNYTLTIITSTPPAVTLQLSPLDDTGLQGDNTTSIRRPRLTGVTGANLTVQIIDIDGLVTGTAGAAIGAPVISQSNGNFVFQFPTALPDGSFRVLARASDIAGNFSESAILTLQIDTTPPVGVPNLRLDPATDTGIKGDGRTSNRRPFLIGTTDPNAAVEIVGTNGQVLSSGTADTNGNFRLQLASNLVNGTITLFARSRDVAGNLGGLSNPLVLTIESAYGDYSTDGLADLALFRGNEATGQGEFYLLRTGLGAQATAFGRPGDIPITGDFDGDGIADIAVFRPESDSTPGASEWFIIGSRTGARSILFGGSGLDLPAPADFDGDGITDIAVFRPDSDLLPGASEWFFLGSRIGPRRIHFGGAGLDVPVPADYDGDGRADIAVFRPDSDLVPGAAQWFILPSAPNTDWNTINGAYPVTFGTANADVPVPGDYNGDGRTDLGLYRLATSQWITRDAAQFGAEQPPVAFGAPGDIPVPADYDGDGQFDLTVFRPSTAEWIIRRSTNPTVPSVTNFGATTDIPVLSPLAFRDDRPGTVVSPNFSQLGGSNLGAAQFSSAPAAATTTPGSLNLGQQAAQFSAAKPGGNATADRQRPAQAEEEKSTSSPRLESQPPARRGRLLSWFQNRRTLGRRS